MCSPKDLEVTIWTSPEECEIGSLKFGQNDVSAVLHSGAVVSGKSQQSVKYSVSDAIVPEEGGRIKLIPIDSRIRVFLNPRLIIERSYDFSSEHAFENIFPPSTYGFHSRMKEGYDKAIYTVQEIEGGMGLWLTVSNPLNNVVYEAHRIQQYEAESLSLFENEHIRKYLYQRLSQTGDGFARELVSTLLNAAPPSWENLAKLVSEVFIPNLGIGATMGETVSQLVPHSFPNSVRDELMAFLAFVINNEVPKGDPVSFSFQLLSLPMLGALIRGHIRCMIDDIEWPPYVKLMTMAARAQLEAPKQTTPESIKEYPWLLFWQKCIEAFPSWMDEVIDLARNLNKSGKVIASLPISKSAARNSRKSWKKRLASIFYDLRIIGNVESSAFGLTDLMYLGAAYRWPHRHMKFITRLGSTSENPPFLQLMTVPLSSVERVKRVLPSIMKVSWSVRNSNLDLFSDTNGVWMIPEDQIINSVHRRNSLRKLQNRFGVWNSSETHVMSDIEAKIIDLVSTGIDLADLESPAYSEFWQIDSKQIKNTLTTLKDRNLIQIYYDIPDVRLISLVTVSQGPVDRVTSLVASLLENTPTSLTMLSRNGERNVTISKLPEDSAFKVASRLPKEGLEHNLIIRCFRPAAFQSYTFNLYQRLLKPDGTWDDDVSAFLSQARSKRKELSESNA